MEKKVRIFIGSSSEAKSVMRSLEADLSDRGFIPVPWSGSFGLALNTLSELWRLAHEVDFAVFVWAADSILEDRGHRLWATRDNVIYEAGLFAGVLSPRRVFLVVKAGPDVKIPSDYLGIGYATYEESDDDCVRRAAVEIQKAIARAEQEMSGDDLTRAIEGLWTDAVVNRDEMSVISTFELRRRGTGALDVVNGRSWDPDGEPRAQFWSTSSNFDAATNTLTYSWQGVHPREPVVSEHFGVGALVFDPADTSLATGWFSSSPRAAPKETHLISRSCRKPSVSDATDLLSDNRKARQEAVKRLLQWRENLR
jgi:predicted nucleotide-binding protein